MSSILILGATSDVGKAITFKYASHGHNIILAGRKIEELNIIRSDLEIRFEIKVEVYFFDAENIKTHTTFCDQLQPFPEKTFCVFGYLGNHELAQRDLIESTKIMMVNYVGAVSILSLIANIYEINKSGLIVGVSSVAGDRGRQSNYYYGSAKAGFTTYLSGLRNRLYKSGVHVLTVKPGFIDTKMIEGISTPKQLTASPLEVAKAIYNADKKKKNVIYVISFWRVIMFIISVIPEFIFKRLRL
ncbi:MAG: SDR family oxidoreductase [Cyclobacteriaceae bacterium]